MKYRIEYRTKYENEIHYVSKNFNIMSSDLGQKITNVSYIGVGKWSLKYARAIIKACDKKFYKNFKIVPIENKG